MSTFGTVGWVLLLVTCTIILPLVILTRRLLDDIADKYDDESEDDEGTEDDPK